MRANPYRACSTLQGLSTNEPGTMGGGGMRVGRQFGRKAWPGKQRSHLLPCRKGASTMERLSSCISASLAMLASSHFLALAGSFSAAATAFSISLNRSCNTPNHHFHQNVEAHESRRERGLGGAGTQGLMARSKGAHASLSASRHDNIRFGTWPFKSTPKMEYTGLPCTSCGSKSRPTNCRVC